MKYTRLTKEQFEELHQEFAHFLAAQNIDKNEWEQIKAEKPQVAEQELDVFSDLIWEGALNKTQYLEHFSERHIFLFHFQQQTAYSIIIKSNEPSVNFLTQEGLVWLSDNITSDKLEITQGKKVLQNKNQDVFNLIQQGALISDGGIYQQVKSLLGL